MLTLKYIAKMRIPLNLYLFEVYLVKQLHRISSVALRAIHSVRFIVPDHSRLTTTA